GSEYFLNGTAGEIGTTAGTFSKKVGLALSTTSLFLYENVSEKFSTSFIASRDLSLATSTVSYSHNLGRIPKQVTASSIRGSSPASDGVIVEGLQSCIYSDTTGGLSDSVNAIRIHTGTGAFVTGFIQNITATSFDVVYTRTSTPTGTAQILFILQ
ncbi:MAG TPA: hypothetical protein PKC87_04160, partial [Candidatus Absconditabacterales bacterium]|nr:hypothetical protein [Candidatus Absconditabacterales bacterium]